MGFKYFAFVFILASIYCHCSSTHYCSLRKKFLYSELFWWAFFPHFLAFGLITERYEIFLRIQCGKMRSRVTPNTDTFYAVVLALINVMHN